MYASRERRAGLRAPLHGPVVVAAAGRQLEVRPVDVSATGIAVSTPHAPPRGTYMRVGFALRNEDEGPARWFEADGVVARTEVTDDGSIVALEFQVIEGHVAAEIQQYVKDRHAVASRKTGEYAPASVYPPPAEVGA